MTNSLIEELKKLIIKHTENPSLYKGIEGHYILPEEISAVLNDIHDVYITELFIHDGDIYVLGENLDDKLITDINEYEDVIDTLIEEFEKEENAEAVYKQYEELVKRMLELQ